MPIYEYACEKCNKRLEVIQKINDPLLTECPECKGKLKKLMSNTSFVLKGTGWYATDFAGKGKAAGAGSSAKESKEPKKSESTEKAGEKQAKAPEAKTEAKTAAAPTNNSPKNNTPNTP